MIAVYYDTDAHDCGAHGCVQAAHFLLKTATHEAYTCPAHIQSAVTVLVANTARVVAAN